MRCFAPEAKSSLAFESPAAEQNMPDSRYVAVYTGVNYKAFCKQKFTANYNELQPVRNDIYHAVCASSVRTVFCIHSPSVVFGSGLISMVGGGLAPQAPPWPRPCSSVLPCFDTVGWVTGKGVHDLLRHL